jgi:hypothetical protein
MEVKWYYLQLVSYLLKILILSPALSPEETKISTR